MHNIIFTHNPRRSLAFRLACLLNVAFWIAAALICTDPKMNQALRGDPPRALDIVVESPWRPPLPEIELSR